MRSRSSVDDGGIELSAVWQCDLTEIDILGAAFHAMAEQSDGVPSLNRVPAPALAGQDGRAIRFGDPFFDLPALVRHIQMDQRVRGFPFELGYDSLHGDVGGYVVIRSAVVRGGRSTEQENARGKKNHTQQLGFHLSPR